MGITPWSHLCWAIPVAVTTAGFSPRLDTVSTSPSSRFL